ncbi:hypothetical protein FGU64_17900 [Mesorhizobium sp. 8]|nr:hypothetical protein FGU64_17900 [Mesorhizobium sp. 8]
MILVATWHLAALNSKYRQTANQQASQYTGNVQDRITNTCADFTPSVYVECASQIIRSTEETTAAQYGLAAQRSMVLWAAAMFWATVGTAFIAAIGIYYVRNTLLETRRIGQAQVRAYLGDDSAKFEWDDSTKRPRVSNIEVSWKNFGQSPALFCGLSILVHGITDDEYGKPLPESDIALSNQEFGTLHISSGARNWCGGASLSEHETAEWLAGKTHIIVHAVARYRDVFGKIHTSEFCQSAHHVVSTDRAIVRFRVYPHHNNAT